MEFKSKSNLSTIIKTTLEKSKEEASLKNKPTGNKQQNSSTQKQKQN